MSEPDSTSPEVADACRRAGLPYDQPPTAGWQNTAAVAASPAGSYQGEQLARAIEDLQGVLTTMGLLYGTALPAPAAEAMARIRSAWDGYRFEVVEGAHYRGRLEYEIDLLRRMYAEVAGERDRARDVGVALEQELAGLDELAGGREPLLASLEPAIGEVPERGGGVTDRPVVTQADTVLREASGPLCCATCSSPLGAPHLPGCGQVKDGLAALAAVPPLPRDVTEVRAFPPDAVDDTGVARGPVG